MVVELFMKMGGISPARLYRLNLPQQIQPVREK